MPPATITDTSLEVLATYLRYQIKVEYPLPGNPYGETMRRTLIGLNLDSELAILSNDTGIWAAHCSPILRPFSQLCDPLPDGTVPAVEALRLALGWPADFYRNRFTARLAQAVPGEWYVRIESYSDYSGGWIRLGGDYGAWLFDSFDSPQHSPVVNPCAAYDYLRSKHFAVGLEPHQYIPLPAPTGAREPQSRGGEGQG